jgi:acyl-CoA synthetase (AMP-forming)/AMP-acid ligase II
MMHHDERLGKTLRAFVAIGEHGGDVDDRALRSFLAEALPAYMVPERVVLLDELPRTVTGKTDYQMLEGMEGATTFLRHA